MDELDDRVERLQAMTTDDGETWDLSTRDKAAIQWSLDRIADLELEIARQQAANSVHMQTLAMVAMWERAGVMKGQEFAKRRKAAADEASMSVRPEHLVRVQVNDRS